MSAAITFQHPEPSPTSARIWPVFLPFAGCPYRCAYCAQDRQTGQGDTGLDQALAAMNKALDLALDEGRGPYELAFYGGTFTALPEPWQATFLAAAQRFRDRGLITRVRCSTRPDCIAPNTLAKLREQGLDMVELGIQSFDDDVLNRSGRGYKGDTARRACDMVKTSELALGIQLLPGLPGDRPGVFQKDVWQTAELEPETARLYPCLVISGTRLATIWQEGRYEPWSLERAREELGTGLPVLWAHGIRVIRLGLPPEGSLAEHILAGPWHPALGQSARGWALLGIIRNQLAKFGAPPTRLDVPRRYQGEFFGHAQELVTAYADLGLSKAAVRYTDERYFRLVAD